MGQVLVTGAAGNLGRHVINALLDAGKTPLRVTHRAPADDGADSIAWDMSQPLPKAITDADLDGIIHLASTGAFDTDTILTHDITGFHNLLQAWQGVPLIYASSQTVYGIPQGPLVESHPLSPLLPYDWGKVCNEGRLYMEANAHSPAWPGISLRLGLMCGANQRGKNPQFLDLVADAILTGRRLTFASEQALEVAGSSFIGDKDAGRGFVRALDIAKPERLNLAGPFCLMRDLIHGIASRLGVTPNIAIVPPGQNNKDDFTMPNSISRIDSHRFCDLTGWRAEQSMSACIDSYVQSLY